MQDPALRGEGLPPSEPHHGVMGQLGHRRTQGSQGKSSLVSPRFWALVRQSRQAGWGLHKDTEGPGTWPDGRWGPPRSGRVNLNQLLCSRIRIVNFVLNSKTAAGGKDRMEGGLCSGPPKGC